MATSLPPPQNNPPDPEVPQPAAPAPPPAPQKEFVDSAGGAAIGIRTKRSPPTENPTPVAPAVNPEVPQPTTEFSGSKKADPDIVDPVVNPEVPQPTVEQNFFVDAPTPVSSAANPEVPQPQPVQNFFTDRTPAPVENYFTDEIPIVQNFFTDATPAPVENFFTDETPIVQNFFTDATPVSPASNPQVPEPPIVQNYFVDEPPIVQNYFTDATPAPIQNFFTDDVPVNPGVNPQVPNIFSSIGALLSSLFGIRPTPVAPAVNPQVARAILVPTPVVLTPRPIPPVSNPQVAQPPIVQNFFTDATPAPVQNFFTDAVPTPIVQNFFTDATPVSPASNPQVPEPPIVQNFFTDATPAPVENFFTNETPIVQNFFTDATPVSPASNPQVAQPATPAPTAESIVNQANPDLAQERFALKIQIERELQPQIARELQEQNPTWSPSRVFATSKLRAGAQADAAVDFRLDQQITAASQNPPTVTPESNPEVPQPTTEFGGSKKADPDIVDPVVNPEVPQPATPAPTFVPQKEFVDSAGGAAIGIRSIPTKIDGPVDQATFQQANPPAASAYDSYVVDTQNKIVEQQTKELEATQGFPVSENQIAVINGEAFGTATIAANVKFKDDIEAARAAPAVPADTPPPTVAAPAVSPDSNAQVPSSANTRVENVNQAELAQKDPALYQQWQGTFAARTEQNTARAITAEEAVLGRPVTAEEKASIAGFSATQARFETNAIYQDELRAANAATVVPADTPPPTVAAPAVSPESNVQVPNTPTKIIAVSSETLLQNDPTTAQEYTAFKNETAAQLTEQRIAEAEAAEGGAISVSAQAEIARRSERDATTDANIRYQDQIEAAGAATVVPANTPPPIVNPVAVTNNPQVVVPPTKIVAVSSETLLQNDPQTAREYTSFKNETAQELTAQRIAEREAVEGGEISVSEQAQIAARANIDATTDANIRYQDQIQAAGAGTAVPADTPPPPTVAAPAVSTESNPQVPVATGKIADFSFSELALKDPDTARSLITDQRAIQQELANQQVAEYRAATGTAPGTPIPDEELTRITVETDLAAKAQVQTQYQDQILAAGAGTLVPTDTPPPTVAAPAVDSATNQQVPPAATGEALIDPDNGEVLGYLNKETGKITDAPVTVSPAANPQVPNSDNSQIASVSQSQLAQTDSALYNDYNSTVATNTAATEEQLTAQALATYGVTTRSDLPLDVQLDIREQALTTGVFDANTLFKDQLEASGAATTQSTGTPPPTVVAAPPSPSPYEVFLAQENAATDAAQAEATARFNRQFDVVTEDPQVLDFNAADAAATAAADNIGEFQVEPSLVADDNSGYADFFGTDADFNVGEFQAEPAPVAITDGYLDFNAADAAATAAADDIGEFQAEPDTGDGESAGFGNFFGDVAAGAGGLLKSFAGAVSGAVDPQANSSQQSALDSISGLIKSAIKTPNQLAAERQAAAKAQAKAQAQVNAQRKQANEGDWRVRLRLAGGADYLYKAKGANGKSAAGILEPLAVTDGVIFPYTPQITTQYAAKYNSYELTHSNYKGYFYQSSAVNEINLVATFTAQDTSEANYLLAVIHFFRSVTKMFYGQDDASKRGAPPPLVFLQGLGEYQFNLHPCVVQSFNYVLPNDCDYIRANSVNFNGNNLLQRRDRENLPIDYVNSVSSRLSNAGLTKGGLNTPPAPPTLGTNSPTYVPTKMEMTLVLLPMQTRSQISQQFSLKQFANGDLIRGGFW